MVFPIIFAGAAIIGGCIKASAAGVASSESGNLSKFQASEAISASSRMRYVEKSRELDAAVEDINQNLSTCALDQQRMIQQSLRLITRTIESTSQVSSQSAVKNQESYLNQAFRKVGIDESALTNHSSDSNIIEAKKSKESTLTLAAPSYSEQISSLQAANVSYKIGSALSVFSPHHINPFSGVRLFEELKSSKEAEISLTRATKYASEISEELAKIESVITTDLGAVSKRIKEVDEVSINLSSAIRRQLSSVRSSHNSRSCTNVVLRMIRRTLGRYAAQESNELAHFKKAVYALEGLLKLASVPIVYDDYTLNPEFLAIKNKYA